MEVPARPLGLPESAPARVAWRRDGAVYRLADRLFRQQAIIAAAVGTVSLGLVMATPMLGPAGGPAALLGLLAGSAVIVYVVSRLSTGRWPPSIRFTPDALRAPNLEVAWVDLGLVWVNKDGTLFVEWRDAIDNHRMSVAYDLPEEDAKWLVQAIRGQQDRARQAARRSGAPDRAV